MGIILFIMLIGNIPLFYGFSLLDEFYLEFLNELFSI